MPAHSQATDGPAVPVTPAWSCPQLDEARFYSDDRYRYIRHGQGEWLFRTQTDLTALPPVSVAAVENFARLNRRLALSGTRLVISVMPPRGATMRQFIDLAGLRGQRFSPDAAMSFYGTTIKRLRGAGIVATDPLSAAGKSGFVLPGHSLEGASTEFYLSGDPRWTAYGAFVTARALRQEISKDPLFSRLTAKRFKTMPAPRQPVIQALRQEAHRICNSASPREMGIVYATVATQTTDAGAPSARPGAVTETPARPYLAGGEVVLVGTGSSVYDGANFSGFLREELATDVANHGIAGGGLSASILSYLSSEDYARTKPKFLIWEMQYHNLREADDLHLIVGAADGDCGKNALISGAATPVKLGQTTAFKVASADYSRIRGPVNAVMDFGKANIRRYHFYLNYSDGTKDRFDIDATRWSHPANKIIVRVPRDGTELVDISLVLDQRMTGKVSARICRATA
ncbi:hypothetical protein [Asticcacaulis sp. AC402]|uniref:alginate O-acetyltransferase AlgX-related protein n=1 Tax=Asticcacaulis sp. AC402 TaxID=1282361 RepID=UPI0003C3B362|nr:hypothetical protein [Asticcacaulis sp. AC402]ESQ74203.1 hypothetical protein ABAC402_15465 [Asticcacaulis sp. AC402]